MFLLSKSHRFDKNISRSGFNEILSSKTFFEPHFFIFYLKIVQGTSGETITSPLGVTCIRS